MSFVQPWVWCILYEMSNAYNRLKKIRKRPIHYGVKYPKKTSLQVLPLSLSVLHIRASCVIFDLAMWGVLMKHLTLIGAKQDAKITH